MIPLEAPALPLSEVARRLAISRSSAHRLVTSGALRGFQVGSGWRVLATDFEAFIDERRAAAEERYQLARGGAMSNRP